MHKQQYKMFKRSGTYYIEDKDTGKQTSLFTKDKGEAITLFAAKNQAASQPVLNVAMAKVYLAMIRRHYRQPCAARWSIPGWHFI